MWKLTTCSIQSVVDTWYYLFIIIIIILVWLFTPASKPGSLKMHPARWAEHLSTIQLGDKHYVESAGPKDGQRTGLMTRTELPKRALPENAHTTAQWHTSHTLAKQCSKFSKPGFNSTWTMNFQMFTLDLEKPEEPEIKLPTSVGSSKMQESSRKTSTSALLTKPKPLICADHDKQWKIFQEMGTTYHLTCLLRNLYAGQEATVRTGHGRIDWFQIGKGARQGCILSPCLFNLYAESIMREAGLDEAQAGIKIARRNINNLRCTDDTTLWK